jgi:hypothetical protein
VDPLTSWLAATGFSGGSLFSTATLLAHEVLAVALAAFGLRCFRREPVVRFLAAWLLLGLLLVLLRRQLSLADFASLVVPLALLGGLGLTRLGWLVEAKRSAVWVTALAVLVPVVFLGIGINGALNRNVAIPPGPYLIAIGGVVAVVLLAGTWLNLSEVRTALALAALLGLTLVQVNMLTRLNFAGYQRAGPALLTASSRPELRLVEERAFDWWRQDPNAPVRVESSLRPLLEWSLRDGPPIEWVSSAPREVDRAILGPNTATGRVAGRWVRLEIAEHYSARPEGINGAALWRWLGVRQSLVRSEPYAILLVQ